MVIADPADPELRRPAEEFNAATLERGHEGVVLKALDSAYAAGRRGASWLKVKPVHTLDLVVLAAEWGHGRRTGTLSNLHLGARRPDGTFAMLGKTFKGLTDALLTWQTERLRELAVAEDPGGAGAPGTRRRGGLRRRTESSRYPEEVTLRFARVVRYREDKAPRTRTWSRQSSHCAAGGIEPVEQGDRARQQEQAREAAAPGSRPPG